MGFLTNSKIQHMDNIAFLGFRKYMCSRLISVLVKTKMQITRIVNGNLLSSFMNDNILIYFEVV